MLLHGKAVIAGLCLLLVVSCKSDTTTDGVVDGQKVYQTYCKLCHGVDGTLGLNGAADLRSSTLSDEGLIDVIANGRNSMQPYKNILSEEEIEAVAEHVKSLRN